MWVSRSVTVVRLEFPGGPRLMTRTDPLTHVVLAKPNGGVDQTSAEHHIGTLATEPFDGARPPVRECSMDLKRPFFPRTPYERPNRRLHP
jgi:hypothetical protein